MDLKKLAEEKALVILNNGIICMLLAHLPNNTIVGARYINKENLLIYPNIITWDLSGKAKYVDSNGYNISTYLGDTVEYRLPKPITDVRLIPEGTKYYYLTSLNKVGYDYATNTRTGTDKINITMGAFLEEAHALMWVQALRNEG